MEIIGQLLGSWQFWVIVALLAGSAFFSASETSLLSVNRLRLRALSDAGNRSAKRLTKLLENPNQLIATILIGNNLVNIVSSTLATALAIQILGPIGTGVAAAVMTVVVLIFGEILPKSAAAHYAEPIAFRVSSLISILARILSPVSYVFDKLSKFFLGLFGGRNETARVTEEEIRTLITLGQEEGVLDEQEHDWIHSVFHFGETTAEEVMVPRIDIIAVDVNSNLDDVMRTFVESPYSRLPVYEGSIENVVGVVYIKDLLRAIHEGKDDLSEILRPVLYVPESLSIEIVFGRMKRQRITTAIVLDEYGQTVGMLTPSDIIEEIMGRIWDEHDTAEDELLHVNEGAIDVDGGYLVEDLNAEFDFRIPENLANTIGGYIFYRLGRIPKVQDRVALSEHVEAIVLEMNGRRVSKVRLLPTPNSQETL